MSSEHFKYPVFGQVDYFKYNNVASQLASHTPSPSHSQELGAKKRTVDPIVTGTSVIAIKYNGGVVMGADTLLSYGSLARFNNIERMKKFGKSTIIGAGGEYSDFQNLSQVLDDLVVDDGCTDDGTTLSTTEIWNYIARVMYNRRNKGDPYWNSLVVIGHDNNKSFLGKVDLVGTCYQDNFIASGYGSHIALPLLRKAYKEDMTLDEAKTLIQDCLRVLFYRDARSSRFIQLSIANADGLVITEQIALDTDKWDSGDSAKKKKNQDGRKKKNNYRNDSTQVILEYGHNVV
ncbi:proteasome subunit beta type 4 [Cavenderia fasciculata]|uniref:Proteasome subunit beta n=1 Tax=Cavenderia fasciculata TaxID=261658 RepID=F4QCP6_CACFS|nr:proteasome subunit beta type 4 [Cavenderia fasciculata]EGG13628.1 proteasome subunit beta type 4 [Cavenderia fasciculata]|eukprot:XP_004350332.1 proteasome subunit beta type 4 [Cavenderia fasciculata]